MHPYVSADSLCTNTAMKLGLGSDQPFSTKLEADCGVFGIKTSMSFDVY